MNAKNLNKKISRLVERIEKDTRKLAKLRLKLTSAEAKKKSQKTKKAAAAADPGKPPKKKKRAKPRISAERRAELSAAMKARWAAKRSSATAGFGSGLTSSDPGISVGMPPL
jgi:hypothetical protein